MGLPLIKEASSESSEGRAGDVRVIRKRELISVHLGDELPVTLEDEGSRADGQAPCPRTDRRTLSLSLSRFVGS